MQLVNFLADFLKIENSPRLAKLTFAFLVNGIILSGFLIFMIVIINKFITFSIINTLFLFKFFSNKYLRFNSVYDVDNENSKYALIFSTIMFIYSYFKSVLTDSNQTKIEQHLFLSEETPRYLVNIDIKKYYMCEYCQSKKFHTASHCKSCNYCVLRRDHHCIWIGNCVGLQNHQYFLNFCFWVIVKIIF